MIALVACLGELGSRLAGASLVLMMMIGAIDIIGTKLFNRPLPAALEATEALMVFGVFLALPYTQANRQHIVVDLLTTRLGPAARGVLDLLARLLTLGVFVLVAWRGWVLAIESLRMREYASGILPFPVYPSKLALAVGATLMGLQLLVDALPGARNESRAG